MANLGDLLASSKVLGVNYVCGHCKNSAFLVEIFQFGDHQELILKCANEDCVGYLLEDDESFSSWGSFDISGQFNLEDEEQEDNPTEN